MAAADVIQPTIHSVFPPVNGMTDPSYKILDVKFRPELSKSIADVKIMWTHTLGAPSSVRYWSPNHFVYVKPVVGGNISFEPQLYSSTISSDLSFCIPKRLPDLNTSDKCEDDHYI
ncbi:hypothetical protein SNE40_002915 [Patella caerulea]|uniref:Uncharacterized protein n=1 Tax=Patella caerulea TaxID=87958 RepID=A0AAN8Q805_PATCE